MSTRITYNVYFGGALMDHKQLIGNALLADAIERISGNRFNMFLPQDYEQVVRRAVGVRDRDLKVVIASDLAIFNFDGTELDSGTVVEFMVAKMLDIPSVLLRTDFRSSGDGMKDTDGSVWNLMCSGYPRSEVLLLHGMQLYQSHLDRTPVNPKPRIEEMYTDLATRVIAALDRVLVEPPTFSGDLEQLLNLYRWAYRFPGKTLVEQYGDTQEMIRLVEEKVAKKLYGSLAGDLVCA